MKNTKYLILILLPLLPILFYFGCKSKQNEVIKIGVVLSLTGDNEDYGKRSLNGIKWATEKLNSSSNFDKEIELKIEDTQSAIKGATNAIQKLIAQGINIVIGDVISGTTLAMAPIAEDNNVLLFAPGASSPNMYKQGKYIFRNWTSDEYDGKAIAEYALLKGNKTFGIIAENKDYSIDIANEFKNQIENNGGRILLFEVFETNSDVSTQVQNLKESGVKNIYISAYSNGTGYVLKKSKELNYEPNFYSTLTVNTPNCKRIAGNLVEGVTYTTPSINLSSEAEYIRSYVNGFKERFKDEPEESSAHGYDAMIIIAKVIDDCNCTEPEKIRKKLLRIENFRGVTGVSNFDSDGNVIKDIFIKVIKDDKEIVLDTIRNIKK